MTEDDLMAHCQVVLDSAEASGMTPDQLLMLAGYLAVAALNHVHQDDRPEAASIFVNRLYEVLAITKPVADATHATHDDADYRH